MIINFNGYKLPQILNFDKNYTQSNMVRISKPTINSNNLAPLSEDTVSFGAKLPKIKAKKTKTKPTPTTFEFFDAVEVQFGKENSRLNGIALVYDAVLNKIASNSNGIFRISNNIEHLVKDPHTAAKKVLRSGTFKVPDIIRQTAFCKDPYVFDNLLYLLGQMQTCRYVLDEVPMKMSKLIKRGYIPIEEENMVRAYLAKPDDKAIKKNTLKFFKEKGYYSYEIKNLLDNLKKLDHLPSKQEFYDEFEKVSKKVPDLDIRLKSDMISPEEIKKLPEDLRYCIGKPQGSGYEDIQMRFIRSQVKDKSKQVPHELIVLFGENYYDAKTRESHFVYSHLRKFKELTVNRYFDNEKYNIETKKAKSYIELIEEIFRGKISRKEFINGKNIDYMGDNNASKISFTKDDTTLLKGYIEGLIEEIKKPYNKAIKSTPKNKRRSLRLSKDADITQIRKIHEDLKETIQAYNSDKAYDYTNPKTKAKKNKKTVSKK